MTTVSNREKVIMKIGNIAQNFAVKTNNVKATPAFKMAKLSPLAQDAVNLSGIVRNSFLNPAMFEKQGHFKKAEILKELGPGKQSFEEICSNYGCSNNPKTNADFIRNQILPKKTNETIQKLLNTAGKTEDFGNGIQRLYEANYDNPDLSLNDTMSLLNLVKDKMDANFYTQNLGILESSRKVK